MFIKNNSFWALAQNCFIKMNHISNNYLKGIFFLPLNICEETKRKSLSTEDYGDISIDVPRGHILKLEPDYLLC